MKVFRVTGTFRMGRSIQKFSKEVAANDEAGARETILGDLGSKHRTPRRAIAIQDVREVPEDEIKDPVARMKAGVVK